MVCSTAEFCTDLHPFGCTVRQTCTLLTRKTKAANYIDVWSKTLQGGLRNCNYNGINHSGAICQLKNVRANMAIRTPQQDVYTDRTRSHRKGGLLYSDLRLHNPTSGVLILEIEVLKLLIGVPIYYITVILPDYFVIPVKCPLELFFSVLYESYIQLPHNIQSVHWTVHWWYPHHFLRTHWSRGDLRILAPWTRSTQRILLPQGIAHWRQKGKKKPKSFVLTETAIVQTTLQRRKTWYSDHYNYNTK